MYFFKYQSVSPLALSMLRHGEIFFASPKELNDSHEARPRYIFRGDDDTWKRFVKLVLVDICMTLHLDPGSEMSKKIISLKDGLLEKIKSASKTSFEYQDLIDILFEGMQYANPGDFERREREIICEAFNYYVSNFLEKRLEELIYIASFSLNANNLTMWGHYGDADKGFSIIYESLDGLVEIESNCKLFWGVVDQKNAIKTLGTVRRATVNLKKVKYAKNPVRINGFGRLAKHFQYSEQEYDYNYVEELCHKTADMHEDEVGLVKYTDWKYEKEIRIHLPVYEVLPTSLRSIRIKSSHIKGVIFGSRMSQSNRDNVVAALSYLRSSYFDKGEVFIFQAKVIINKYKIMVDPVGVLRDFYSSEIPIIVTFSECDSVIKGEANMIAKAINCS